MNNRVVSYHWLH